jgi:ketosteroid isomerase-like protein
MKVNTLQTDPIQVARRFYAAWPARDRAAAEELVSQDFHFTSPLDNRLDRATFFERCWPNSAGMAALGLERVVASGDIVFVTYEVTLTDGTRFRNTEVITVSGGQVREAEVYFGWYVPHRAREGLWIEAPKSS